MSAGWQNRDQSSAAPLRSDDAAMRMLFATMFIIAAALTFRSIGIQPVVLGDEYTYSKFARLLPFSDSTIPGYLFLAIYRATNVCGNHFLECGRVLNAAFFVASAPFIYAVARAICSPRAAMVVTLAALLGPADSYTAYFMPEALYFLAFWVFTWHVLRMHDPLALRQWVVGGVLFGLAALIKPHAFLCFPALIVYILGVGWKSEARRTLRPLRCAVAFAVVAFAIKLGLGYLFAGAAGLTIFGPLYTSIARDSASNFHRYLHLATTSAQNAAQQMLAVVVLFGLPMACTGGLVIRAWASRQALDAQARTALYAVVMVVSLLLVTAVFSVSIANADRLHLRYYNFAFPLLIAIAASPLGHATPSITSRLRAWIAVPLAAAVVYAAIAQFHGYKPNLVDCPELAGLLVNPVVFVIVCALGVTSLAWWILAARAGSRSYVYVFVPVAVAFSAFYINAALRQRLLPDAYDRAALFTRQYLPNQTIPEVLVAGNDTGELLRALFHLDSPRATMRVVADGVPIDLSSLPAGKEWLLAVGRHPLVGAASIVVQGDGFVLAQTSEILRVDFRQSQWPDLIDGVSGLSYAESWGTWSNSSSIALRFRKPLPPKFTVHLRARAFGPNAGSEIVVRVGSSTATITLGESLEDKTLAMSNAEGASLLSIAIPHPASPRDLGMSADSRNLGIGIVEIRIAPL